MKKEIFHKIRNLEAGLRAQHQDNPLRSEESTHLFSSEEKEKQFVLSQFQTSETLQRYKEYRLEWHRRWNEMDAGTKPLSVICELVSICNLRCEMCYTITPEFQESIVGVQRMLPWDTVKSIIDECAEIEVPSILFSWRGESAMYRSKGSDGNIYDFADVMAYAREKGILEVTSLTNGRLLKDDLIERIVEAQPNWISFSVDGYGEDYNKIRRSAANTKEEENPFVSVTNNIKKMVRIRDMKRFTRPQIRTNSIFPPLARDPIAYREYMESIGVSLVTINELLDFRGDELPDEAVIQNWFCQYPFQRLTVSANGIILPCPGAHNEEDELVLGRFPGSQKKKVIKGGREIQFDYEEKSLIEAWNSDEIKHVRKMHKENRRIKIGACRNCRHGAKHHDKDWIPEDWDMEQMKWADNKWRE